MEYFRGDTFLKNIKAQNYTFQEGDKIHIAILKNAYSKEYLYEEMATPLNTTGMGNPGCDVDGNCTEPLVCKKHKDKKKRPKKVS